MKNLLLFALLGTSIAVHQSCKKENNTTPATVNNNTATSTANDVDEAAIKASFSDLLRSLGNTLSHTQNIGILSPSTSKFNFIKKNLDDLPLPECGSYTETRNDTEIITIIDYGNGCSMGGTTQSGKITTIENLNHKTTTIIFTNYASNSETMNGSITQNDNGSTEQDITYQNGNEKFVFKISTSINMNANGETIPHFSGSIAGTHEGKTFSYNATNLSGTSACGIDAPLSGTLEIMIGTEKVNLNFGSGECDEKVTVSYKGATETVLLKDIGNLFLF